MKTNKNQTAIERLRLKHLEGERLSRHFCIAKNCPDGKAPIMLKDLQPVTNVSKKTKTVFYHKECWHNR